ncbi:MAG: hypothetical protein H0V31_11690, partial [Acidobacteria bacterium]|nr:hypothetical protein [Acidobacteriota bacterium]
MARSRKDKRSNQETVRSNTNHRRERKFKRQLAPESSAKSDSARFSPIQLKSVERLLQGIGTPEPRPFVPDAFQTEALEAIE